MFEDPAGASGTGTGLPSIDDPSLVTIERRLASYLGPVAAFKLRRALSQSRTAVAFCELLSDELPECAIRDTFVHDVMALLNRDNGADRTGAKRDAALATAELEALRRALAQMMGAIAPHLIQRARVHDQSTAELEAACVAMISDPRQRLRFSQLLTQYRGGDVAGG
jgi:hypothetical protein